MRIGIDISQIVYLGTGVGRFTNSLVDSILKYDNKNKYVFFFSSLRKDIDKKLEKEIKDKKHQIVKWKLPLTLLSFLWNDLHSFLISQFLDFPVSLDFFITSDWTEPPVPVKKTTVVHDLAFKRYPETFNNKITSTQEKRMKWVKKESKIIFADSQATKDDLINYYSIDPKRIIVNYPGVTVFSPSKTQIRQTLTKYQLNRPFILSVGKLEPRKNIDRLVQSFERLNQKTVDLVIVGSKGWDKQLNNLVVNQSNIKFLGYVNDEELNSLYKSCLFFIYPSIWEGFGYPVIEAMRQGAPVATSNVSSLKEITNNAALLFDPFNTDEMSKCINILIHNEKLRNELAVKGKKQAEMFSWERYYKVFIKALNSKS